MEATITKTGIVSAGHKHIPKMGSMSRNIAAHVLCYDIICYVFDILQPVVHILFQVAPYFKTRCSISLSDTLTDPILILHNAEELELSFSYWESLLVALVYLIIFTVFMSFHKL